MCLLCPIFVAKWSVAVLILALLEVVKEDIRWSALIKATAQRIVVLGIGHHVVRLIKLSMV